MTYQLVVYLKALYKKYRCAYCGVPIQKWDMACIDCVDQVIEKAWEIV